jgi:hypothetical protein
MSQRFDVWLIGLMVVTLAIGCLAATGTATTAALPTSDPRLSPTATPAPATPLATGIASHREAQLFQMARGWKSR